MLVLLLVSSTGFPAMVLIVVANLLAHPFDLGAIKLIVATMLVMVILLSITSFLVDLGKVTIKLISSSIAYTITKLKGHKND